jgi:hypothetical protein
LIGAEQVYPRRRLKSFYRRSEWVVRRKCRGEKRQQHKAQHKSAPHSSKRVAPDLADDNCSNSIRLRRRSGVVLL